MIYLKECTKIYKNKLGDGEAFRDINIVFPNIGLVLLKGKSGSGKTSLLNCIGGLDSCNAGEILYSEDLTFSFVFQDYQLIEDLTVKENLMFLKDLKYFQSRESITEILERVGLLEVQNHYPNELSGGQKQRLSIARAILQNAKIVLVDEPSGNLDVENTEIVVTMLRELSRDRLVIVASHEPEMFNDNVDGYISIDKGAIIETNLDVRTESALSKRDFSKQRKLPIQSALKLAFKGYKKALPRIITTILLLIISIPLLLLFSSIAFSNNINTAYKIFEEKNLVAVDYLKSDSIDSTHLYKSMTYEELDAAKSISINTTRFQQNVNLSIDINENDNVVDSQEIQRVYITNKCHFNIISGSDDLSSNNVLISDILAHDIYDSLNIDSLDEIQNLKITIGEKPFNIAGIYETGYYTFENLGNIDFSTDSSIMISEEGYVNLAVLNNLSTFLYEKDNNEISSLKVQSDINLSQKDLLFGNLPENQNEIVLTTGFAKYIYGDYVDYSIILGNFINLNLISYLAGSANDIDISQDITFSIVGIYDEDRLFESNIFLSDSYYYELALLYSLQSLENSSLMGISIANYNPDIMNEMDKLGLVHITPFSQEIYEYQSSIESMSYVLIALIVCMSILNFIVIIRHIKTEISLKTNEFGVLLYLGLKEKELVKIPLCYMGTFYLVSAIISTTIFYLSLQFLNNYLVTNKIIDFKAVYFSLNIVLSTLVILLIFGVLYSGIIVSSFRRNNPIDMILGRK